MDLTDVRGQTGAPARRETVVLLSGDDPDELRAYVAPLLEREDTRVETVTDEYAAIDRLDEGGVDCLVASYDPSGGEGMELLDSLRDDGGEVPVILMPSTRTTVIDSRNFVVDVASVVEPGEAVGTGGLAEDVVDTVERKRATVAARRRDELERVIRRVARDAADADDEPSVASSVADRLGESEAVDAAWVAAMEDDGVSLRASAAGNAPDVPREVVGEAVERAFAVDGPEVATHGDHAMAAVPVETPSGERWAVTMAAESRYAFSEEELRVLAELRDALARALPAVVEDRRDVLGADDRTAFAKLVRRLDVPVVAYDAAGWVAAASRAFGAILDAEPEDVAGRPVWDVLPEPRLETFDDHWAAFDEGDARSRTVALAGHPRELVTTRVSVAEEPYNVALAVEPGEDADAWLAEVLAYELRHWLGVAQDAADDDAALDSVADRVRSAVESEVSASGDDDPHVTPQPIGKVASEAWAHVLGSAGDSEVHGGRTVLADRAILFRLFAHIFRTLLTYGEASAVDVGVREGGFFVEDDGAGVHHADRAYAEATTMTDAKSGASIRVARRLAKRHGWDLQVGANEQGGTRFEVRGVRTPEDG